MIKPPEGQHVGRWGGPIFIALDSYTVGCNEEHCLFMRIIVLTSYTPSGVTSGTYEGDEIIIEL